MGSWPTLLIVGEDPQNLDQLVCHFEKRGFHVAASQTIAEARELYCRRKTWDLILSDTRLRDGTGWELCCWVREQPGPPPPVLLMPGHGWAGALYPEVETLAKPVALAELDRRVAALVAR